MEIKAWRKSLTSHPEGAERATTAELHSMAFLMASSQLVKKIVFCMLLMATSGFVEAQGNYAAEGTEYNVTGTLPGEQVYPHVSLKPSGGYVVWRDNITDGDGYGISARKVDSTMSPSLSVFRVNQNAAFDQDRPVVTMLNDGGAAFVWQGGKQGFQHIYARFLSAQGLWVTGDLRVNAATNAHQLETTATTLTNGNVVVAWSSFNQVSGNSLRDVYFQILTPAGVKVGTETLANQVTAYNQRAAAAAALSDGRFVLVWVSEQQRFPNSVDIYARFFTATGAAAGGEFLVNSGTNVCSGPTVAAAADGGFMVAWAEKDLANPAVSWDIKVRPVSSAGFGGTIRLVNARIAGDQFVPSIAARGNEYLVSWTSLGQDGSREGVYGRFLQGDGSLAGEEFRVNTTTLSQQIHPVVASDGVARFLAVWSSFVGSPGVFDVMAQRYVSTDQPLAAPGTPIVSVLNSNALSVSWPPVSGLAVAHYEVYADGAGTATAVATNTYWSHTGLAAASTHTYRVAYVLTDGRRSPLSGAATNTTYSGGATWGGIPQEWMTGYFGSDIFAWPSPFIDSDDDGVSNRDEFLQGTNPTQAGSVLKVRLQRTAQGLFLNWNTQPGLVYQVWAAAAPGASWTRLGGPRFAAGAVDSMYVEGSVGGFYRIERLR